MDKPIFYWLLKPFEYNMIYYFDGLVQERRNSIANALELHISCTNLSIYEMSSQDIEKGANLTNVSGGVSWYKAAPKNSGRIH